MEYKKRIAPAAHRDISSIKDYIANDKPNAAVKMANEIYNSFDKLQENPLMGAELRKKFNIDTDYRFWIVKPYIVFYKLEDDYLSVYRVLDGRSDYLVKLGLKK